jgi:hypothetical protein
MVMTHVVFFFGNFPNFLSKKTFQNSKMASAILIAVGLTASAIIGRAALRTFKSSRSSISHPSFLTPKQSRLYLRGGFEQTMSKREAAQILGVKESIDKSGLKVCQTFHGKVAHRKVMLINHPDRGGSPYMSMKINEVISSLISRPKSY